MKKKKHQDFQKTKLKVGRRLPKGANETKTSFQTRKINLLEQIKETVTEPTLKELLSYMKSTDVKIKHDNLRKLFKYVLDKKDSVSMFFRDILKEMGRNLQESDPRIRSESISVLRRCSEILTDTQFKSFVVPLTLYLKCMMTHNSVQVRQDSLKYLDALLDFHPHITCQSYEIPYCLLNLISSKESSTGKKGSKNKGGRKLLDVLNARISTEEWRTDVLKRMLTFLNGIVSEKNSSEMDTDDQKEVYWNAKEALYLPLYLNSGVKPAEFDYSLFCSVSLQGSDSENFEKFINELICIIPGILTSFHRNTSYSEADINYFSIIMEILCCIGEWTFKNLDLDDDLNPTQNLITICCQLMPGFPYNLQSLHKDTKIEKAECVELNLEICYLYCMCSLLSDRLSEHPGKAFLAAWGQITSFICGVVDVSGVKLNEKLISLTLKITRTVIQCKKIDDSATNGMLLALLGTLETKKFSSSRNDLYTFFMELSMNYDYKHLLETNAMRIWFGQLIENLIPMVEFKMFVPNYINYIKQICARRNPHFMLKVNALKSEKFIELLKVDDEDFQLAIIHLIASLDKISPDFLQDLAETIRHAIFRDETFSLKTVSRLIRMLHSRFSKSDVPPIDQMNFFKFLLNLACDSFLILDPSLNTVPLPLTHTLITNQQAFACQCEIYATQNFERHQELFEVCLECLTPYLREEIYGKCTAIFMRAIFREHIRYPVHSVVAIIELFKRFTVLNTDGQLVGFLQNFIISCLIYNSIFVSDVPEELWTEYCVPAVQECLDLVAPLEVIAFLDDVVHSLKEKHLKYTMRIFVFLMQRGYLEQMDKNLFLSLLGKMGKLDEFPKHQIYRVMLHNIYDYISSKSGN